MSSIVVRAISAGRWSIGPGQKGQGMKLAKNVPGYEGECPGYAIQFFRKLIVDSGGPVPNRLEFFKASATEFGAPRDWIQAEFPAKLRLGETTAARRTALEDIARYLAVA